MNDISFDSDRRCSLEQVLSAFASIWYQDTQGKLGPFDSALNLHQYFDAIDDDYWIFEINDRFSTTLWYTDFKSFHWPDGLSATEAHERSKSRTISDLAEFLRDLLPPLSLKPISIAGTVCPKAAAFLAITYLLPKSRRGVAKTVAPSTRLRDCLTNKQLNRLARQLKCLVLGRSIDGFEPVIMRESSCDWVTIAGMGLLIGPIIGWCGFQLASIITIVVFLLAALIFEFCRAIREFLGPSDLFAPSIVTFRDLAIRVAAVQNQVVRNPSHGSN